MIQLVKKYVIPPASKYRHHTQIYLESRAVAQCRILADKICQSFLELYVNGKFVDRAEDDALTSGDVGLFAGTYADSLLKVSFDNFVVRSIP